MAWLKIFDIFLDDLSVYREGLLAQGFWALQIHRFGHARFAYSSKLIRIPWAIVHTALMKFSEIFLGIFIGPKASIGKRLCIEHFGCIVIHGETIIGDDCVIRQGVTIGNRNLEYPYDAPIMGNRVNIGAGAKILGKLTIGDDVTIGANAVVLDNVPSGHLAVGVPAKIKSKNQLRT